MAQPGYYPGQPESGAPYPPPQQGGFPPPQQPGYQPPLTQGYPDPGYAPQQGYAPPQPGYAPPQQGYAPPQPGYAPPQQGYAPPQQGYAPQQPGGGWMQAPPGVPGCPPGLEYLTQVDQILVHQQVELLEALSGFETANKYEIKNSLGQKVYFAAEQSDCCTRQCCGPIRNFEMKIIDNLQQEVMHLDRPLRCASCWTPCCLQQLIITSPPGTVIGSVEQTWDIFLPKFDVKNEQGETVLKIEGPCFTCNLCGDVEFKVHTKEGNEIGKISKQWSGLAKELFTDSDNFGVQFPMDLDVKMKACLLGAVFLIDFMFFEETGHQDTQRVGVWH